LNGIFSHSSSTSVSASASFSAALLKSAAFNFCGSACFDFSGFASGLSLAGSFALSVASASLPIVFGFSTGSSVPTGTNFPYFSFLKV